MSCEIKKLSSGVLFNAELTMYPTVVRGALKGEGQFNTVSSTYFGFVAQGSLEIMRKNFPAIEITKGMYFSAPGEFSYSCDGSFFTVERHGYRGLFTVGGPVEESGRLCYIDNCSVTQLIPPTRLGDPTLQQLVFPPGVDQTMHIHPTLRMGYVHAGSGFCKAADGTKIPLEPGNVFYLSERHVHGFQSSSEGLVVIAYHPDSDVGPTDQSHPMLSRTYAQR